MPIQLSGSLVITGSITTTGVITMSGSIASASYSSTSDLLQGTGSVGFTTTASFNAVSSSQQQLSSSYISLSASYNTFSGSASTRITVDSASLLQVSASLLQVSASLLNVIAIGATTGSNSFRANQSITGSLVVSSTITAQTLVVQTITSSIEYSSGSNIFGSQLTNTQTFTGSVNITGSTTLNGALTADTVGFIGVIPTYTNNYISFSHTCRSGVGDYSFLSGYDGSTIINAKNGYAIDLRTNNATKLTVNSSGSVGINTDTLTTSGLTGNILYLRASSSNIGQTAIAIQDYRKCTRWAINGQDGLDNFNFAIYSTPNNTNDYTRRFSINQQGNIGIGSASCTWRNTFTALQVGTAALTTNSNAYGYFSANFYNDADGVDRYISSGKAGVIAISNGEIIFYNTDASCAAGCVLTSSERMRITSVGNVGIGLTLPTALLHLSSCVAGASNSLFIQNSCTTGTGTKIIFAPNSNFGVNDSAAAIASCSTAGGYDVDLVFTTYKSAVGPIERMRIAGGTGAVTRQCQPYFYADTLAGGSLAGQCTVIWGNLRASQNTGYNTANGVFTAPVTGVYAFSWVYLYQGITNPSGCIDDGFSLNGTQIFSGNRYRICQRSWGDQYVAVQGSAILRLAANDYFKVMTANTGDSGLAAYGGSTWGYLTGALI